jgi:hypothetical protein
MLRDVDDNWASLLSATQGGDWQDFDGNQNIRMDLTENDVRALQQDARDAMVLEFQRHLPEVQTWDDLMHIADTLAWRRSLDDGGRELRAGPSREQEAEALAAWGA